MPVAKEFEPVAQALRLLAIALPGILVLASTDPMDLADASLVILAEDLRPLPEARAPDRRAGRRGRRPHRATR